MAGKPPKSRNGVYLTDAQQLIHLSRAVLDDVAMPAAWRADVSERLNGLARTLMDAHRTSLVAKVGA